MEMSYHRLGKSELMVSRIGFGCMSLTGSAADHRQLTDQALELGINYFDTADLYNKGANEELVGTLLKHKRKDIVLATKVGNQYRADGSGWDWNPRKAYILSAVEGSLKRLQTDYIDLYQLHGGTIADPMEETIEAFERLKEQGKIRYYGISSIRHEVIRAYIKRSSIVSVMMQYSLLDRRPEESCLDLLEAHQISICARGALAQGLLTGKPAAAYLDWSAEDVAKAAEAVRQVTAAAGSTAAATAIRFALQPAAVRTAVIGIRTAAQLHDAVAAGGSQPLSESELSLLQQSVSQRFYTTYR